MSDADDQSIPSQVLGRRVIGICPECEGEGVLWGYDGETHWADRCKICNCVGFILDLLLDPPDESDQEEIPF